MWLDAIMIFPIVVMGLERLIDKKDGRYIVLRCFMRCTVIITLHL
mgnify:FL=1